MPPALRTLYDEARKLVTVRCDEYHAHSALEGCLGGPEGAITICKFAEYALALESAATEFQARVTSLQTMRGPW